MTVMRKGELMQKQKFDEIISYVNKKVSEMEIETKYKIELLGMVTALGYAHEKETHDKRTETHACDCISRQAAIDAVEKESQVDGAYGYMDAKSIVDLLNNLPSAQPERKWAPCSNPPKHHKDVIVRGIEAIGNVTVHKVMQWDIDTWRPTDYAPSVSWKEWSEI